ncbi:TolB family protein [Anaerobacillus sp. MEB173]|uniref:TolB family protein n=1 Tax=Anaerobacillus sp. MEB173 TaxID=3383345 RepID=UPI003F8DB96D
MKKIIIFLLIFLLCTQNFSFVSAETNNKLKAAFIKNNDLWIKIEDKEMKITSGEYVRFPKWSYDGNWIAYLSGRKENETTLYQGDLWLYDVKSNNHFKATSNVNNNIQWAPNQNTLAFQSDLVLEVTDVKSLNQHHNVASGIINFSWLPDGKGFITSSKAGESVFSDILLTKIIPKNNNQYHPYHLYTIRVGKNDYFYGTSQFKWSYDHNWIAFQITPTASLSADSNTLAVLSNDGKSFYKIDEMLNYEEWFNWAPRKNFLAYIQGFNRISTLNKKLKVKKMFVDNKVFFTPKGYVDRDLTWRTDNQIVVSRSAESDLVDVSQRPMPSIYHINLETKKQRKITLPQANEGDFYPISINNGENLIWIRTNRGQASVWIGDTNGTNQRIWIKQIDLGTLYYEHWNWKEVFSLYRS